MTAYNKIINELLPYVSAVDIEQGTVDILLPGIKEDEQGMYTESARLRLPTLATLLHAEMSRFKDTDLGG